MANLLAMKADVVANQEETAKLKEDSSQEGCIIHKLQTGQYEQGIWECANESYGFQSTPLCNYRCPYILDNNDSSILYSILRVHCVALMLIRKLNKKHWKTP